MEELEEGISFTEAAIQNELGVGSDHLMSKLETVINSDRLYKKLENLPERYMNLTDDQMIKQMRPTKIDWRIRIRFWQLIGKALDDSNDYAVIFNVDIFDGIVSKVEWYHKTKRDMFIAWLFRPIGSHVDEMDTMINVTREHLWTVINNIQVVADNGKLDMSHANMVMRIHDKLVDRKIETLRHLIEMKKLQKDLNEERGLPDDLEYIDAQINDLEAGIDGGS